MLSTGQNIRTLWLLALALIAIPSAHADFSADKNPTGCDSLLGRLFNKVFHREAPLESSMTSKIKIPSDIVPEEVRAARMLPRGSALITQSGDLTQTGIRHIIHAASGSMARDGEHFSPSLEGVTDAIRNSLELAKEAGHARVAVPFVGGKIFIERIGIQADDLVRAIVDTCLQSRGALEIRFVIFGDEDTQRFQNALSELAPGLPEEQVSVVSGSLTDFNVHGASAIINAANMEVKFGGGLSGAISRASGKAAEIDQEAADAIRGFYESSH